MMIDLVELAEWRAQTDAHLAKLDYVTQEHEQDLRAKRGADNKTLSAVRETQLDHGKKLDAIEGKVDNLSRGQKKLGHDVEALQAGMGEVKGRLGKVEDKLTVIATTQAEHTRAIAAVETRLDRVDERFDKVDERLDKMDGRLDKMDGRLDKIDEKLDLLIAGKASS